MDSRGATYRRTAGFSLVEMALVSGVAILVIGVSVLSFHAIGTQQRRVIDYGTVELGQVALENLYGLHNPSINTWFAPNYGRAIRADQLRDVFHADIETASAIYCLARAGRNPVRPTTIPIAATLRGYEIDTPSAFLTVLSAAETDAATTYTAYQGVPPTSARNGSIFVIQPATNDAPNDLAVRCIWEIDIIPVASTTGSNGTYATVRRYVGFQLTHYYDVFYHDDLSQFGPPFVSFERAARTGGAAAGFRQAGAHPFYFVWWPDPVAPNLRPNGSATVSSLGGEVVTTSDFRAAYGTHFGQTSYLFVVPVFPCVR